MQGAQNLFTEDQDGIEKTQASHKITKPFLSKVCYVFLGLTFAFILVSIIWKIQSKTSSESGFVIPPADADTLEVKSNQTCPVWSLVGDGYCDDEANIPECGHDFDDCCQVENDRSICQECYCFLTDIEILENKQEVCGLYNFELGNGRCNFELNKVEFQFDVGDCCLPPEELTCRSIDIDEYVIPCPDNPCIKSNNFCIPDELGDSICQDHNNGPFCGYDLGDCCLFKESTWSDCCTCSCHMNEWDFIFDNLINSTMHLADLS